MGARSFIGGFAASAVLAAAESIWLVRETDKVPVIYPPPEFYDDGEPADDLGGWRRFGSWWVADVSSRRFEASCGPLDLSNVIGVFRPWAE